MSGSTFHHSYNVCVRILVIGGTRFIDRSEFRDFGVETAIDLSVHPEREAAGAGRALAGVAARLVVASSADVYRERGR